MKYCFRYPFFRSSTMNKKEEVSVSIVLTAKNIDELLVKRKQIEGELRDANRANDTRKVAKLSQSLQKVNIELHNAGALRKSARM